MPCRVGAMAVCTFVFIRSAFGSGVGAGAFTALFFFVAVLHYMAKVLAFVALCDPEMGGIFLRSKALAFDQEVVENAAIRRFSIVYEDDN